MTDVGFRESGMAAWVAAIVSLFSLWNVAQGAPLSGKETGRTGTGAASEQDSPALEIEYGIMLALHGEFALAESAFVSVLSGHPKDSAALTNLGNLQVLNGDLKTAIVFYEEAFRGAPDDPGIHLDRAIALLLLGEHQRANEEALTGIRNAGDLSTAMALLGIRDPNEPREKPKAGEQPVLSEEEVQDFLTSAIGAIPVDSTTVDASDSVRASGGTLTGLLCSPKVSRTDAVQDTSTPSMRTAGVIPDSATSGVARPAASRMWRSAGPRAVETGAVLRTLYWKR